MSWCVCVLTDDVCGPDEGRCVPVPTGSESSFQISNSCCFLADFLRGTNWNGLCSTQDASYVSFFYLFLFRSDGALLAPCSKVVYMFWSADRTLTMSYNRINVFHCFFCSNFFILVTIQQVIILKPAITDNLATTGHHAWLNYGSVQVWVREMDVGQYNVTPLVFDTQKCRGHSEW